MTSSRTILVTGATGGIGRVLCQRLARDGHALLLLARDSARLEGLQRELFNAYGTQSDCFSIDMADEGEVSRFSEELARAATTLDGVVLMPPQIPPTNESLPENSVWRGIFEGSFIGPLGVLRCAIANMKPDPAVGRRAKIVIISGISSAQVLGHYATSNVLRCAWLAEAKTLAFALGPRGIHVNTLSLGGTLTPDYVASIENRAARSGKSFEERLAEETSNVPLGKYGRPEEVAEAVVALLCGFSDHITGVNILHDGGFTRAY